jgi:hypothetical protein
MRINVTVTQKVMKEYNGRKRVEESGIKGLGTGRMER